MAPPIAMGAGTAEGYPFGKGLSIVPDPAVAR